MATMRHQFAAARQGAQGLFDVRDVESAERGWRVRKKSALLSRIAPLKRVADTNEKLLYGIMNASVTA